MSGSAKRVSDEPTAAPPAAKRATPETAAKRATPETAAKRATPETAAKTLEIKQGDLLSATETYIVHQCNAVSSTSHGLSKALFARFPYADIYAPRRQTKASDKAGDVVVRGDGKAQRYVVNLIGQVYPGAAKYGNDTAAARLGYFRQALDKLRAVVGDGSVAFPYKIGCGLGGGDWAQYEAALREFAQAVPGKVVLYQLPPS